MSRTHPRLDQVCSADELSPLGLCFVCAFLCLGAFVLPSMLPLVVPMEQIMSFLEFD